MATLSAKKIKDALKKAQNVGQVEESITIDGCEIVLQSLTPDGYAAVSTDIDEIPEGIGYLNAFKREHLARSLVEVNGVSLRGVDLVEVEVEEFDPKTQQPVLKLVKVERHAFVRDHVINTWAREAIDVAFRKFNEVVGKAEKLASAGVTFSIPDETEAEKYRRLLVEAKEVEGSIPVEVSTRIRGDLGFIVSPQPTEYAAATDRLSKLAEQEGGRPEERKTVEGSSDASQGARVTPPAPSPPPPAPSPPAQVEQEVLLVRPAVPIPGYTPPTPEELMAGRQPLNRVPVPVPVPASVATAAAPPPNIQVKPVLPASEAALRRAAEIAALEGEVGGDDPSAYSVEGGTWFPGQNPGGGNSQAIELSRQQPKLDPKEAERIIDQPPIAGINPRFRPPPRI